MGSLVDATEVNQSLDFAFNLDEQSLRSLVDLVQTRLRDSPNPESSIEVAVRVSNGASLSGLSIDDVLKLENNASQRIVYVRLTGKAKKLDSDTERKVEVEFENIDEAGSRSRYPLGLKVSAESRDWAFVTAAHVRERLQGLRAYYPQRWLTGDYFQILLYALGIIFVFVLIPLVKWPDPPKYPEYPDFPTFVSPATMKPVSARVRERLKDKKYQTTSGGILAYVEAIEERDSEIDKVSAEVNEKRKVIQAKYDEDKKAYEKAHDLWEKEKPLWTEPQVIWGAILLGLLVMVGLRKGLEFLYPPYSFAWGAVARQLEAIKARRSFVYVVVIAGLAIGVAGSFVYDYLKTKP